MLADLRAAMKQLAPLAIDFIPSHPKVRASVFVQEASYALPNADSLYALQAVSDLSEIAIFCPSECCNGIVYALPLLSAPLLRLYQSFDCGAVATCRKGSRRFVIIELYNDGIRLTVAPSPRSQGWGFHV